VSATSPHPTDALLSLVYGELPEAEAARVQAHVDGCAACTEKLASYRAVRRAAAALPLEIASDQGLESLLHHAARAAARARRKRKSLWTGSLLGALVAAALVLVFALPSRPPETLASAPGTPPAVGPLAQNDVRPAAKAERQEVPEVVPTLRRASSVAPASPSAAKAAPTKPSAADNLQGKDVEGTASEERGALADHETASGAIARAQPQQAASQRAALAAGARGAGVAGASAPQGAPQALASAPAPADAAALSAGLKKTLLEDAGPAQALADEQRRRTLLQKLQGASGAQALPLLSELCALEAKLGHRAEALKTCSQVTGGYPGTNEATSAQRVLEAQSIH
jgi:Putative zinc-finger